MTIPVLKLSLPAPVRAFHQLELTSICDLRCPYCPSPHLARPKQHMTWETFERALEHVAYHQSHDGQVELNIAGIGESTLHPEFCRMMVRARERFSGWILLASNGITISGEKGPEIVRVAREQRVSIWISLHRPERAGLAVERCKKAGVLGGVSNDPSINADDWAGQVNWFRSYRAPLACQWIREQKVMVMADGRVTTCCLDASGVGVIGDVSAEPGSLQTQPYGLCKNCQQQVNVVGYEQREGRPDARG